MKKVLVLFSFVFLFMFLLAPSTNLSTSAEDNICYVVAVECNVYEDKNFNNAILDDNGDKVVIKHKQQLKVIESENEKFIKVEYKGDKAYVGYVYARYVTFNSTLQQTYPVFNANIAVDEADVFTLDEKPTEIKLEKGHELYLYEGYHKNKDMTPVCFVQEDGSLYYGLIETHKLSPYGINAGAITGIVVAISCVTIILLLLFMKKVKKKKTK